ncbi:uncharacterized protein TNCV_1460491 [Trichonephila clavipes]|nr:uncharacterized protein TNCV_1460491 [Trichonephila clavipes]
MQMYELTHRYDPNSCGHSNQMVKVTDLWPACHKFEGCGSPVVHGRHVMSSSLVPLKIRRVGQRCTLNLSRAETSSCWCSVVVKRGGCHLRHLSMVQNFRGSSPKALV